MLRCERKMSQSELAEQLGVTLRTVQHYEAGTRLPKNMLTTDRICKLFCIQQNELFCEEDSFEQSASELVNRARRQANSVVVQAAGLFAGSLLEDEDMDAAFQAITEAYWMAKESRRKYSNKKRSNCS